MPNVRVRGRQWRRQNLRNVPARQAAAAAAQANQNQNRGRGAARARGRARGRRAPPQPVAPGRRPVVAAGQGEKNIDNAFIRNRGRYKIKRIMPARRNVEVKHRGQTVRRMVARRRAIYPILQPQQDY